MKALNPPASLVLAAVLLALSGATGAQPVPAATSGTPSAATPCPAPQDMGPQQLYGLWQLSLWPEEGREAAPLSRGALLFERHPEYPGSVRGDLRRSGPGPDLLARVSGDVTQGEFNLDESADGQRMDAVWTGEPEDCGRSIRGIRRPAEGRPADEPALRFHLYKLPGWR